MLGRRAGTFWCGAKSSGGLEPQRASPPSPHRRSVGPQELNDRNWTQRGGAGEGGRDGGCRLHPFPSNKHFTFVDTASLASRRPRLAARRDPPLVVFEKSRDFANPLYSRLLKLLLLFVLYCFEGRNKLDMLLRMHTQETHTHFHKPTFQALVPICSPLSPAVMFTAQH